MLGNFGAGTSSGGYHYGGFAAFGNFFLAEIIFCFARIDNQSGSHFGDIHNASAPQTDDQSDQPGQISPVESARAWESEAEDNVIQRLERAGLLAPEGEVDKVLETVVTNLEITNSLDIQPPVRCRILLTHHRSC